MKDNIKIALLAIIAAASIFQILDRHNDAAGSMAVNNTQLIPTPQQANRNPLIQAPANGFDPMTPATPPPAETGPKTSIHFGEMFHDFGHVMAETPNKYTFKFTNTGTRPLVISNAKGDCGCTVPDYPKEPIPAGGTGVINVVFTPHGQGHQEKHVTVTANTDPDQTKLTITGEVQASM